MASAFIGNGVKRIDKITYYPAQEEFIDEGSITYYNLWNNPGIKPCKGNVDVLLEHIEYLFPDKEQRDVFLDFLAHNIQFPGTRILWMLIVYGEEEGTGKSFFKCLMQALLGHDNVSTPSNEEIHERFSTWQKQCQLIVIEELMAIGRRDLMNKLKPLITEEWTRIREMHKVSYDHPNRFNLMAFTNHADALPIHNQDRRYCIVEVEAKPKEKAYYTRLFDWIKDQKNIQASLYYFLQRDLSDFNPKARAPKTKAKINMIEANRTPLEEWIIKGIEENAWPFDSNIASIRHLKEVAPLRLQQFSDYKYAAALQKAGAVKYEQQVTLSNKSRATLWVFGSQKGILLQFPTADMVQRYENGLLKGNVGGNPLEELKPM